MLYIIGLGLNYDSISEYGLAVAQRCKRIYLEEYTVDFPYDVEEIRKVIGKKIICADREKVEGLSLIDEAKKLDVALLVYGSPLTATTHITLIEEAKKSGLRYKIIYNASVLDAVAETGLQLYKFGKIASMPIHEADSYVNLLLDNQKINAHSLILVDIGMEFKEALERLKKDCEKKLKLNKILVCSKLGVKNKRILYDEIENLEGRSIQKPYCIIIPSKLHFTEKEMLETYGK